MAFDYVASYDAVEAQLVMNTPPSRILHELSAFGQENEPHEDWQKMSGIPINAEPDAFTEWLQQLLTREHPTAEVVVLWFGLFNPVDDAGRVSMGLYVAGSNSEDPYESGVEDYWVEGRYFTSQVLDTIYQAAYESENGLGNNAEYMLGLGYASSLVKYASQRLGVLLAIGGAESRKIVVGFDNGDSIDIGSVTSEGFQPVKTAK